MKNANRRTFIVQSIGMCAALAAARSALAAPPLLAESDPAAKALGYRANAATVDTSHFPKYQAGQRCSNCRFYGGSATDPAASCPMFPGKAVAGDGWCNVYAKRA